MTIRIPDRTGVILAAGFGSRISADGFEPIKPLVSVRSVPMLLRAIHQLEIAECRRIVIVLGHRHEEIRLQLSRWQPQLHAKLETVFNPEHRLKNGVSLLAAREKLDQTFILAMSDHVLGDEVMKLAARHTPQSDGATLLVDRRIEQVFDIEDATKVRSDGARLIEIGKALANFDAVDVGLFVATHGLLVALHEVFAANGDASLSEGVQRLARAGKMSVLDIGDGFWQDVDDAAMLEHVERELARRGE